MKGNCTENKTAYDCLRSGCEYAVTYDGCQFHCTIPKEQIISYIAEAIPDSSKQKEEKQP